MVEKVGAGEFDEAVLKSDVPVLVDFFQLHCLPCKRIEPVLEDVARAVEGKGRVLKVQFEDSPELVLRYDVVSFPTMILFEGGLLKKRLIGPRPADVLIGLFDEQKQEKQEKPSIEDMFAL